MYIYTSSYTSMRLVRSNLIPSHIENLIVSNRTINFSGPRHLHISSINHYARTKFSPPRSDKQRTRKKPASTTQFPIKPSTHLRVTDPIPPTKDNIQCSESHPLWQFFHNKQFIRSSDQLDLNSRAWSIPELRRKSFNDLHSLWYNCLIERNKLAREIHLVRAGLHTEIDSFVTVDERIRTTMWRIRHVLSERDHAFKAATANDLERQKLIEQFSKAFTQESLDSTSSSDDLANDDSWEKLKRFQWALFGINEIIEENKTIDSQFVQGIKLVANLKLQKLSMIDSNIKDWYVNKWGGNQLTDIAQCFVIFSCENDVKSTLDACSVVDELRSDPSRLIPENREIQTVRSYIQKLIESTEV